jgi:hypothetical protein
MADSRTMCTPAGDIVSVSKNPMKVVLSVLFYFQNKGSCNLV